MAACDFFLFYTCILQFGNWVGCWTLRGYGEPGKARMISYQTQQHAPLMLGADLGASWMMAVISCSPDLHLFWGQRLG